MPFTAEALLVKGGALIKPAVFRDVRGCFVEIFKHSDFLKIGIADEFLQDSYSVSVYKVLRGLHFNDKPGTGGKLVYCIKGRIYEVIIDVRPSSPTFKKWQAVELSSDGPAIIYVPFGCAHGYMTLTEDAIVGYKLAKEFFPGDEDKGLLWNDPDLAIKWPHQDPVLSDKDRVNPCLKDIDLSAFGNL